MTKEGHSLWVCSRVCVCVCKSMTVNGRNPSTNPHLSSWITDIINRRYSSISPVFPIQRWGAGLFPSLSADLMTFTKLPYACVCIYIYIYIHSESNVFVSVCFRVHVSNVCAWQHLCRPDAVWLYFSNIVDQFGLSGLFGFWFLQLSVLATMQLRNHPQRGSATVCSCCGPGKKMKKKCV